MVHVSWKLSNDSGRLSIYNWRLVDFLELFHDETVERLTIYWISKDKDFKSVLTEPISAMRARQHLLAVEVAVNSVELTLSNGFEVDSNLEDEIFCSTLKVHRFRNLLSRIKSSVKEVKSAREPEPAELLPARFWDVQEMEGD